MVTTEEKHDIQLAPYETMGPMELQARKEEIIADARNNAEYAYGSMIVHGEERPFRREGYYPTIDKQKNVFECSLFRVTSYEHMQPTNLGGEYRILYNGRSIEFNTAPDIIDVRVPVFLLEYSFPQIQETLAKARTELAKSDKPGFLIQARASDINDGEIRDSLEGQKDIFEERWYGLCFNIMNEYPNMTFNQAQELLYQLGYHSNLYLKHDLGIHVVEAVYFPEGLPKTTNANVRVITADDFITPFGSSDESQRFTQRDIRDIIFNKRSKLIKKLDEATSGHIARIDVNGKNYRVEQVIEYPIKLGKKEKGEKENGEKVHNALLLKVLDEETGKFQTVRVVWQGDPSTAYWRMDSICRNGVEGGDGHCDCKIQLERELQRWKDGESNVFISLRDHEGKQHSEGHKGGTLTVQRQFASQLGLDIGNPTAAELYYKGTGKSVDARDFGPGQAVVKYLLKRWNVPEVPILVTNNQQKIAKILDVATIGRLVDADVDMDHLTDEAQIGVEEKFGGKVHGVVYVRNVENH